MSVLRLKIFRSNSPIVLMLDSFVACALRDARVQRLKKASITCVVLDKDKASHPWARLLRLDETGDIETRVAHMDFRTTVSSALVQSRHLYEYCPDVVFRWNRSAFCLRVAIARELHANVGEPCASQFRGVYSVYLPVSLSDYSR